MRNPTTGARRYQPIGHLLAQKRHWPRGSGTAACHPQRASKQLPPQLGERLLSSDGQAPWNDSHGRRADVDAVNFCRRWFRVPSRGLAEDRWWSQGPRCSMSLSNSLCICVTKWSNRIQSSSLLWLYLLAIQASRSSLRIRTVRWPTRTTATSPTSGGALQRPRRDHHQVRGLPVRHHRPGPVTVVRRRTAIGLHRRLLCLTTGGVHRRQVEV